MELTETFTWQGRTVACGQAGTGPDVVLGHGTPWSSRVWSPFADALASDFTVHLWDMPGYGASSKRAEDPVDLATQAATFAALLEHRGLDRPHVVAHDIGGSVALQAALFHDAAYASLMLVDVVAIPPAGSPFFRFVQEHPDVLAGLPAYVHEAIVRAYVAGASHCGLRPDDLETLVAPWLGEQGQPAFYRQIAGFDEDVLVRTEAALGDLDVPVAVVWGREDTWIPLATGRRLADLLGVEVDEVADAGHLIHHDAPGALADRLRRWLTARSGQGMSVNAGRRAAGH